MAEVDDDVVSAMAVVDIGVWDIPHRSRSMHAPSRAAATIWDLWPWSAAIRTATLSFMFNNTVVFGDDESPQTDLAWLWLNSHTWPRWRLEVVHALSPSPITVTAHSSRAGEWTRELPRRVFAQTSFEDVVHLALDQDPRVALSRPAGLLVVAAGARGGGGGGSAKPAHIGETARWLLDHPPAPMLIARRGHRTGRVVVGHDGSPHAWTAIAVLCRLPWVAGLDVTVVGVDEGRDDVRAAAAKAAACIQRTGALVRESVTDGDPTDVLLEHVHAHQPDLIVLGTRGLTGMNPFTVGSTAAAIAHSTNQSMLLACDDATSQWAVNARARAPWS